VTHVKKVKEHTVDKEGAYNVKVQYLLHKGVGAKNLQLRLFKIDIKGYTPLEKHAHEHEVFILRGTALLRGGDQEFIVGPKSVIFIQSLEEHQFKNIGDEPLEFLCTKETYEET
jgi:quercetin dioxygenase-like cupin family protein